jgi:hypothetical protein
VTANAAIVPAGTNGSIDVFVTNSSDLVIDINGYFAPPNGNGLSLFTMKPCRVLDSRNPAGAQPITAIDLNVAAAGCGAPASAQSYLLNATVVPQGPLGFLTLWPKGSPQPLVSTLNAIDSAVTSNLAIVPANNGSISAFASNPIHLVLDISGYFAPTPAVSPAGLDISAATASRLRPSSEQAGFIAPVVKASDAAPPLRTVTGSQESVPSLPALFTLHESPGSSLSATVAGGEIAIYQLEAVAAPGFTGVVQFDCSSVPKNATCTIQPGSVDFGMASSANVSVTVATKVEANPAANVITLTATHGEQVQTITLKLNVK